MEKKVRSLDNKNFRKRNIEEKGVTKEIIEGCFQN